MASSVIVMAEELFASAAATWIADLINAAIDERGDCSLALCGGHTPERVHEDLAARPIRWAQVAVYFGDERAVPPDHPDSNFGMARRTLLDHVPVPFDRVHRMAADRPDLAVSAEDYARLLPTCLDVLLLGLGPDGHTASLFPGSPAVLETGRMVVAVPPPPIEPRVRRMTITPPVIQAARNVVVLVTGPDKAAVMARVLDGPSDPAALPAQIARRGTWIVDRAAASQLHRREF